MDIQSIITQMTLEEKAALCTGATNWKTVSVERLGIPSLFVADGPHGVRKVMDEESMPRDSAFATCFPTASCMGCTWNTELIGEVGKAIGEECIALDVDVVLGPGVNMKRSPLCGRNFEYYSEDPVLAGYLAASFINGVQSKGVGTSLKHFAANNQEYRRFSIDVEVDERTLREIYLRAFEIAVKQARPWTVMCAYNKINGTFCSENHELLTDILKDEWGFEGFVVSDWGAVHDRVLALKGGLDLEMPGPRDYRVQLVVDAVNSGELDVAVLDESVKRILQVIFRAKATPKGGDFDIDAHHALARKVASEGMVLLKNNGLLPLRDVSSIAVIGKAAKEAHFQGEGSSHINPTKVDNPFDELQELAGDVVLTFGEGYAPDGKHDQGLIAEAVTLAEKAEVALLYLALPPFKESEGYDRPDLALTEPQIALIKAVAAVQPNTVVILNNGAPVVMSDWIENVSAVLEGWMMGQAGGGAIADILMGKVNPSGKLAETFPRSLLSTPAYINWPGGAGAVRYGEGIFVGYRFFDKTQIPVLFPFGFGLSYTSFEYSNPRLSATSFEDRDGVTVSVDVTNTGDFAGQEIIQVYVHDRGAELVRPEKELKGFAKVSLQPGETKTASINLDFRAFAYFHPRYKQWITEDGEFDILIGASSVDIRHRLTTTLKSTLELPCLLDQNSTIGEWMADPRGSVVAASILNQIQVQTKKLFGEEALIQMYSDTPFASVLGFNQNIFPIPADILFDNLMKELYSSKQ